MVGKLWEELRRTFVEELWEPGGTITKGKRKYGRRLWTAVAALTIELQKCDMFDR